MSTQALDLDLATTGQYRSRPRPAAPPLATRARPHARALGRRLLAAATAALRGAVRVAALLARVGALPLVYALLLLVAVGHGARRLVARARGRRDDLGFEPALLMLLLVAAVLRDGASTPGSAAPQRPQRPPRPQRPQRSRRANPTGVLAAHDAPTP